MKRMILIAVLVLVLMAAASSIHVDGQLQAVGPRLAVTIRGSEAWYTNPTLASRTDDPRGVYVVLPAMPAGPNFAAIRVDTATGEQTQTSVTLDPGSPYRAFVPATVRADVRGLHFGRPAFHLLSIPNGGGPGVHRVDSATGRLAVKADGRTLLTRNVFNSSSTPELLSLVSEDPDGRWLAALARTGNGWSLFLFTSNRVEES
jgi:hypothetical protein